MHACTAILAALHHRTKTGVGQNIDISMMDCLFSLHENTLPWFMVSEAAGNPIKPAKIGQKHPGYAPYGIYKGKNGFICIACLTEARWLPLVELMGEKHAWLKTDPRAATVSTRCSTDNAPIIHEALEEWVMSLDSVEEAERLLEAAEVPCLRVRDIVELATVDPQIKAREMIVTVDQPFLGPMKMYGSPLKFSETPSGIRGYGPFLGEHNDDVLMKTLGMTKEEIKALYAEDVLYHAPEVDKLNSK
jgi:crotonobetainyl-CoA:carnitine CoA-transferase CaiB-like acyl-CoA transferase